MVLLARADATSVTDMKEYYENGDILSCVIFMPLTLVLMLKIYDRATIDGADAHKINLLFRLNESLN